MEVKLNLSQNIIKLKTMLHKNIYQYKTEVLKMQI